MPEQNPAIQLDAEEQQLLSTYAAGAWRSVATPGVIQTLREAARATGQKDSIRTRALQEGVPYQTLISSVLHKYVSGNLQDQPTIKSAV